MLGFLPRRSAFLRRRVAGGDGLLRAIEPAECPTEVIKPRKVHPGVCHVDGPRWGLWHARPGRTEESRRRERWDSQHIGEAEVAAESFMKQSKIWNRQSALRRRLTSQ